MAAEQERAESLLALSAVRAESIAIHVAEVGRLEGLLDDIPAPTTPAPPESGTPSDSAAYWKGRSEDFEMRTRVLARKDTASQAVIRLLRVDNDSLARGLRSAVITMGEAEERIQEARDSIDVPLDNIRKFTPAKLALFGQASGGDEFRAQLGARYREVFASIDEDGQLRVGVRKEVRLF